MIIRPHTIALLIAIVLIGASLPVAAQDNSICDGRFERFLKGYRIGPDELTHFLQDEEAVARCRGKLDASRPEHRLIEAYVRMHSAAPELDAASRDFAALCGEGNKIACFYLAAFEPGTARVDEGGKAFARLGPLLEDVPAAAVAAGGVLLVGIDGVPADADRAAALFSQASSRGDYWGSFYMALRDSPTRYGKSLRDSSWKPDMVWLQRAADQGNVMAQVLLAEEYAKAAELKKAAALLQQAAGASGKQFRTMVAEARYRLGHAYDFGQGVERDPLQARKWREAAAELGHNLAQQELKRN